MAKNKKVEVNKEYEKPVQASKAANFMDPVMKIKMTGDAKGEVLIVDLEDYFERLNRQGWGCVKRERL